jgi:hypothetical protein
MLNPIFSLLRAKRNSRISRVLKCMICFRIYGILAWLLWTGSAFPLFADEAPLPIQKADVLPLALNDHFKIEKFKVFNNAPPKPGASPQKTRELAIDFERASRQWGALDATDYDSRFGEYFTFFWKSKYPANLILRFEYRQANLKNYVQAREISYPNARGTHTSEFDILGNDYTRDGRVIAWRVVLIQNRAIVALLQSRVWR